VRRDRAGQHQRREPLLPPEEENRSGEPRPEEDSDKTVRIWHVVQIERIRGKARVDAQVLDSGEHEAGPEHVDQLHRDRERPERKPRLERLGEKCGAVVSGQHF
jgi:hypothetical protein